MYSWCKSVFGLLAYPSIYDIEVINDIIEQGCDVGVCQIKNEYSLFYDFIRDKMKFYVKNLDFYSIAK